MNLTTAGSFNGLRIQPLTIKHSCASKTRDVTWKQTFWLVLGNNFNSITRTLQYSGCLLVSSFTQVNTIHLKHSRICHAWRTISSVLWLITVSMDRNVSKFKQVNVIVNKLLHNSQQKNALWQHQYLLTKFTTNPEKQIGKFFKP